MSFRLIFLLIYISGHTSSLLFAAEESSLWADKQVAPLLDQAGRSLVREEFCRKDYQLKRLLAILPADLAPLLTRAGDEVLIEELVKFSKTEDLITCEDLKFLLNNRQRLKKALARSLVNRCQGLIAKLLADKGSLETNPQQLSIAFEAAFAASSMLQLCCPKIVAHTTAYQLAATSSPQASSKIYRRDSKERVYQKAREASYLCRWHWTQYPAFKERWQQALNESLEASKSMIMRKQGSLHALPEKLIPYLSYELAEFFVLLQLRDYGQSMLAQAFAEFYERPAQPLTLEEIRTEILSFLAVDQGPEDVYLSSIRSSLAHLERILNIDVEERKP